MIEYASNLLGVLGLAVADQIREDTRAILKHSGETPAALVVIGYGFGPSNDTLRRILGLSHSGTVRLVDRLVEDGLVRRRSGRDQREVALFATRKGEDLRERILKSRIASVRSLLEPLSNDERKALGQLLFKILSSMDTTDMERQTLCRLCDKRVCRDCPIPAAELEDAG